MYLKKYFVLLTMILCTGLTLSAQRIICLPVPTYKQMIVCVEQGKLDSIALAECREESNLYEAKFEAMLMQSESFSTQLKIAVDKYNDKVEAEARKKKWNSIGFIGSILTGLVTGFFIAK